MMAILLALALFAAAFFAIRYFSPGHGRRARLSHHQARILYWILAGVVLIWLLAQFGVFGDPLAARSALP